MSHSTHITLQPHQHNPAQTPSLLVKMTSSKLHGMKTLIFLGISMYTGFCWNHRVLNYRNYHVQSLWQMSLEGLEVNSTNHLIPLMVQVFQILDDCPWNQPHFWSTCNMATGLRNQIHLWSRRWWYRWRHRSDNLTCHNRIICQARSTSKAGKAGRTSIRCSAVLSQPAPAGQLLSPWTP